MNNGFIAISSKTLVGCPLVRPSSQNTGIQLNMIFRDVWLRSSALITGSLYTVSAIFAEYIVSKLRTNYWLVSVSLGRTEPWYAPT